MTKIGYPQPSSPAITAVMKANRKTGTKPEVRVRSLLHRAGLRFRKNMPVRAGGVTVRPDIVFRRQKVAVFIDGCFWHGCPDHGNMPRSNTLYWETKLSRNRARDALVNATLGADGWHVLRIWEHVSVEEAACVVRSSLEQADDQRATSSL